VCMRYFVFVLLRLISTAMAHSLYPAVMTDFGECLMASLTVVHFWSSGIVFAVKTKVCHTAVV